MPSPHDLTTLADLKSWLGITSTGDDMQLAALITDISVAILADLGRASLRPAIQNETRDGDGGRAIVLRQWPVVAVTDLTVEGRPIAVVSQSGQAEGAALSAVLDGGDPAPPGGLQRLSMVTSVFPRGVQNVAITYRAGYEVVAEAASVPLQPPYALNALAPYGAWCDDGGVSDATGTPLAAARYTVVDGLYTFTQADAGTSVLLTYGFIPADLARACRDWAAERYAYRARIGQSSRSLGGQETTAFIVKAMPDFVSRLLQPYRRVVRP